MKITNAIKNHNRRSRRRQENKQKIYKNILKSDTVVLACSGPSLNKINPFSLGFPVVAISTAIRADVFKHTKPDAWALVDVPIDRKSYQGKSGQFLHTKQSLQYWEDSEVLKVMPAYRRKTVKNKSNFIFYDYDGIKDSKKRKIPQIKEVFNGKTPFVRGPGMSITFALQWCHYVGVRTIIFTGCDLVAPSIETKYAYNIQHEDKKKRFNEDQLSRVKNILKQWYPIAQRKGFKWYNWQSGPVLGSIIPSYPHSNKRSF